ncbi:nucleotidyltransferase family protein [Thalassotalea sp. ND16A]|uniref:nucleotidyltransferase family protein n=1 Tax=Thalassotalea sp. ND16A TaxID=1535422 RepID=UPI001363506B|nr:nucleotidyltransferase family protein [Thalassotalea sp. ND16A]
MKIPPKQTKITEQTFIDLGMWLTHPEQHTSEQLSTLLDEDARLPLLDLINSYWLGGAMHNSLKASSIWQQLDSQLTEYLAVLEQFFYERNQAIKQEAIFACQILSDANIPVVMLKGGASIFNGVFNPISNRFMTDIDLLVPENLQQKASDTLISHGYAPDIGEHDIAAVGHHHAPALTREGSKCSVELHRWALKKSVSDVLATAEVWQQATPLALTDNLPVLQMAPSQQVILSIAHSELSHSGFSYQHIDWRQLLNLYALVNHYHQDIDWETVHHHFARCHNDTPYMALNALLVAADKFLKLATPITKRNDKAANKQVNDCINLYVKRQQPSKRFAHLLAIIKGYSHENIKTMYGESGKYPMLSGRLKHLKRHLTMLSKPRYLAHFINLFKN